MQVEQIIPPTTCFLKVKLDQVIVDYLWKIIEIGKIKTIDVKEKLAGNISQSYLLEDLDAYFYKNVCVPLVKYYREKDVKGFDPVSFNALLGPKTNLILNEIWVNYQYQTEFNPFHDHGGVYSFAIWMKIPYEGKDQQQLPQFKGTKSVNKKAGNFEFEYIDSLGDVRCFGYQLSPKKEGTMLFFPAKLRHCVYPFYGTDEPRISISGNLFYCSS